MRCAAGGEGCDVVELAQRDLAVGDEIGAADIEIIAAAARQIFELPAGVALAVIQLESDPGKPVEQRLVEILRLLGQEDMTFPRQRHRHRRRDQVVIFQRAFIVGRIGELRRRFDIGDQGRAALHQRHLGAARIQVLRDIVAAVAGADHDRLFALPVLAVVIAAGMHQRTGEIFQAGNLGHVGNAADAGRHHHMARMHGCVRSRRPAAAAPTSGLRLRRNRR